MRGIIVADASPLHYLILIDNVGGLPVLFEWVLIPLAVRDELVRHSAPQKVKDWISNPPAWLKIESVTGSLHSAHLHPGEAAALQLALETKTSAVLVDDLDGRAAARRLGLNMVGTIGVLERMSELGLLDIPQAIGKLRRTNFFASPDLLNAALERDRRRRST
jgi:predicted nucleic acid-binding protein